MQVRFGMTGVAMLTIMGRSQTLVYVLIIYLQHMVGLYSQWETKNRQA